MAENGGKTTPKDNARTGIAQGLDLLSRPLLPVTAVMLRGLLEYIGDQVEQIQELKQPRRARRIHDPGAVGGV